MSWLLSSQVSSIRPNTELVNTGMGPGPGLCTGKAKESGDSRHFPSRCKLISFGVQVLQAQYGGVPAILWLLKALGMGI